MSLQRHVDVYFDDLGGSLRRAGWALRRRRSGENSVATLKGAAEQSGALHARQEIEVELDDNGSGGEWPAEIIAAVPAGVVLAVLRPLVELRVRRVSVPVARSGTTVAELAFDEVVCALAQVAAPEHVAALEHTEIAPHFTFYEVEIEALGDDPQHSLAALNEVAAAVMEVLPLVPSSTLKFERAAILLGPFLEDLGAAP